MDSDFPTICLSGLLFLKPRYSKNGIYGSQSAGNQQLRSISSLVGTSETIRATQFEISFREWLAGLIDGDGCLLVSKQGYISLEIIMDVTDVKCLQYIKQKLGGSIKMRSGANSWRYRLHYQEGVKLVIANIAPFIRHSTRKKQLDQVTQKLGLPLVLTQNLYKDSNWFSGFFDAVGTILLRDFNIQTGIKPLLIIRVNNKLLVDIEAYRFFFGGTICYDSSHYGHYVWSIQSRLDILNMYNYFKDCPSRSHKAEKIYLIKRYYELFDLQAYHPDNLLHKVWQDFLAKWNRNKL